MKNKPYLQLTAQQKRQAVLDLLNVRGGMVFADIKTALGATQSLSSVINIMARRGEVTKGARITGNQYLWLPAAAMAAPVRYGPEDPLAEPEQDTSGMPDALRRCRRVVRLLDKPNTSRGGQCALYRHHGIQSGMRLAIETA